jgi:CheY-like chemotaxis protein
MRKRILLVASETDVIQSVPVTLRLAGHRVALAKCGLQAIKQARTLLPDLVLVDSLLPDMDGATVVDILRRLPSTWDVRTMLFKPRWVRQSAGKEGQLEPQTELLVQVGEALALCQAAADTPEPEMEAM